MNDNLPWEPLGSIVSPTPCLRFIIRDGKKILQQAWQIEPFGEVTWPSQEWRDVPLVEDEET